MKSRHQNSSLYIKKAPKTYEWYTPADIVDRVVATLGQIDLDPCSNEQTSIPASTHFTKNDDGLSKEWCGKVFMNPPWGTPLKLWAAKLVAEVRAGRVTEAISLTPAQGINRKWFDRFIVGQAQVFVTGAVKFWNDTTDDKNPGWPFPIMIQYFGPHRGKFIEQFGNLGIVVRREETETESWDTDGEITGLCDARTGEIVPEDVVWHPASGILEFAKEISYAA